MSVTLLLAARAIVGVAMLAVALICALFALTEYDRRARVWAWFNLALGVVFFVGGALMLEGY